MSKNLKLGGNKVSFMKNLLSKFSNLVSLKKSEFNIIKQIRDFGRQYSEKIGDRNLLESKLERKKRFDTY